jgi:hypothetical protein
MEFIFITKNHPQPLKNDIIVEDTFGVCFEMLEEG